jgi:hypothetical protein
VVRKVRHENTVYNILLNIKSAVTICVEKNTAVIIQKLDNYSARLSVVNVYWM